MDGELDNQASQFLLKRLAKDEDLSRTWENYHMIRSCLQKEKNEPLSVDISQRVMSKIHHGDIQVEAEQKKANTWLKPLFGTGIAATVAFVSIIMVQNKQPEINSPTAIQTVASQPVANQPQIKVKVPSAQLVGASRSVPAYLTRYPSVSAKESSKNYQPQYSINQNMPYVYILNYNPAIKKQSLSPLKKKEIAD